MRIQAISRGGGNPHFKGTDDEDKILLYTAMANRRSVVRRQNIVDVDRGIVGQISTSIRGDVFTRETTLTDGRYVYTEEVRRFIPEHRTPQTLIDLLNEED